jgi:hypothetical protein
LDVLDAKLRNCNDTIAAVLGVYKQAVISSGHSAQLRASILAVMASLARRIGDCDRALEFSSTALRLATLPMVDNIHGTLLSELGQHTAAVQHLSRAIINTTQANLQARLWANLGWIYIKAEQDAFAKKCFDQSRIVCIDRAGEALFGLRNLGEPLDLSLIADTSNSLHVQISCVRDSLKTFKPENFGKLDEVCDSLRPTLERLHGVLGDEGGGWLRGLLDTVHEELEATNIDMDPNMVVDYSDVDIRQAVKRLIAEHRHELENYISHNPFDLRAYQALIREPSKNSCEFICTRLRLLEERYDPKDGTMCRDFSSVQRFEKIKEWIIANREQIQPV